MLLTKVLRKIVILASIASFLLFSKLTFGYCNCSNKVNYKAAEEIIPRTS